jgi:hypothetical protein
MRFFVFFTALCALLLPAETSAKRAPAPKIDPVFFAGVEYTAPNDRGTVGYVLAHDANTGEVLWKKTIFRVWICPLLEHDVQWVFIKEMRFKNGQLIVVNERKKTYSLDLKTRIVRRIRSR